MRDLMATLASNIKSVKFGAILCAKTVTTIAISIVCKSLKRVYSGICTRGQQSNRHSMFREVKNYVRIALKNNAPTKSFSFSETAAKFRFKIV